MKTNFLSIAAFAAILLTVTISSCKKDSMEGTGSVEYELEHYWASTAFALNTDYVTSETQTVKLSKFKYLVSNFRLVKADGSEYAVPESYFLVDASVPSSVKVMLKEIPSADYKSLKYIVGVDSARNTAGAQTGALATTNDLYWSWNSGYIFMKAEGTSPQNSMGISYHIGGFKDANAAQREITINFGSESLQVRKGNEVVVHAKADVKKLFNGFDVSTTSMMHMPGPKALQLADNYAQMFSFEHLHN